MPPVRRVQPAIAMPHQPAPPFAHTSGPHTADLAFVAEAFGEQEALTGRPLIGNAGQEFTRLCREAGIDRGRCFLTNTMAFRPYQQVTGADGVLVKIESNDFDVLCANRAEVGKDYTLPQLSTGKFLKPEFLGEIERLREELETVRPNLCVALGAKALWALCRTAAIGTMRGTVMASTLVPGLKILPTYHPSYLFKVWSHRPVVLADLMKARREGQFPEIRRPDRSILVSPTISELSDWVRATLAQPPAALATDVETMRGQITMIGFARSRSEAIVCPFFDPRRGGNYWPTFEDEFAARMLCGKLLASPIPKVTQNGLYDIQYFLREGYRLSAFDDDTMLLHHSMFPEMQKGLGFLGSIYTSEPAWKLMRHSKEELKRDE